MNTKKTDFYNRTLEDFAQLKKDYPNSSLGKHIELAFGDYNNLMSLTDKELNQALEKYMSELEFDIISDQDLAEIIKDGEHMFDVDENIDEDRDEDY